MTAAQEVRLVVLSNRLPAVVERQGGGYVVRPGSGGLVTALSPILRQRGGFWIGWSGTLVEDGVEVEPLFASGRKDFGCELVPIVLTRQERGGFYQGFSNEIIWPLFHNLGERCNFQPSYWDAYKHVNARYAEAVLKCARGAEEYLWVHDYHLMLVGQALRQKGLRSRIGFFLHIPFPPLDMYLKLPWRFQVLRGLLDYDAIGFQTVDDRRNFVQCVRTLIGDVKIEGRGRVQELVTTGRRVRIGTFPISIDFDEFASGACRPEVTNQVELLRRQLSGRKMILGVDRLDYTKGVPDRLRAFGVALRRFPQLREKVTLVQVLVPSREAVPAYQRLKEEIDLLVGEINGEFTMPGWVPIHYLFRSLSRTDLLAYYRTADVGMITPLNDGMNLVAKEYCACNLDERGVLILSEFAGAAAELQNGALLVNPHDVDGMAEAIHRALTLDEHDRKRRMARLRKIIRQRDIHWWLSCNLQCGLERLPSDLPPAEHYIPTDRHGSGSPAQGVTAVESDGALAGSTYWRQQGVAGDEG